jgi:hypothetical protein
MITGVFVGNAVGGIGVGGILVGGTVLVGMGVSDGIEVKVGKIWIVGTIGVKPGLVVGCSKMLVEVAPAVPTAVRVARSNGSMGVLVAPELSGVFVWRG